MKGENQENSPNCVIFEYLTFSNLLIAWSHLLMGREIWVLEVNPWIREWTIFSRYLMEGRIKRFSWEMEHHDLFFEIDSRIFDRIDAIYREICGRSPLPGRMERFLGSPEVHLAFKKRYAQAIYQHLLFRRVVSLIRGESPGKVEAFPAEPVRFLERFPSVQTAFPGLSEDIPCSGRVLLEGRYLCEKLLYLFILVLLPFYVLLKIRIPSLHPPEREHIQAAIRIYSQDFGFHQKHRSIDFLVGGECPDRGNTLFCIETDIPEEYHAQFAKRGYRNQSIWNALRHADLPFISSGILGPWIRAWAGSVVRSFSGSSICLRMTVEILITWLQWKSILNRYAIRNYITYNDFLPKSTVRNIVLRKGGCRSWLYLHSSNHLNYYVTLDQIAEGREKFRALYFAYTNFDTIVSWNDKLTRYYRAHPSAVRSYENLGCIWSESVMEIRARPEQNRTLREARNKFPGVSKIAGIFDTSFGGINPLEAKDLVGFNEGILRLLGEEPRLGAIVKMKWRWETFMQFDPSLRSSYERLRDHPRCIVFSGYEAETSEVIAASDIVISACFTSPSIEALGARVRAMFYDAAGRFRGYYPDGFPGLVAHGYPDLVRLVRFWLYGQSDLDFHEYLETHIRGEVDGFIDGKAVSRFRRKLCGNESSPPGSPPR